MQSRDLKTAVKAVRSQGGTLRTRDLIALGVHADTLYALRESGKFVEPGRGLHRPFDVSDAEYPDLAVVAAERPTWPSA